jgi:signal transduction histidine kinase
VSDRSHEPGQQGLWQGILVYRWIALGWMTLLGVTAGVFRSDVVAYALFAAVIGWNVWWTTARGWLRSDPRWFDLAISTTLIVLAGLVQTPETVVGDHPFFATGYPVAAAMTIAAANGLRGGLVAASILSVALVLSRPLNEIGPDDLTAGIVAGLVNGVVYYFAAGAAVGLVSDLLHRSDVDVRRAQEEALRERERAARVAEHESMGRQIHDSVLQSLARVVRRGRDLAAQPIVSGAEVGALAAIADEQSRALRALIRSEPEDPPPGAVPLRTVLQAAAYGIPGLSVAVATVDPVWLRAGDTEELSAAIHQALENVAHHSGVPHASVFGERDDAEVVVSVRDDGAGFRFDEERFRRDGKIGVLSMRARMDRLGGSLRVISAPGMGTELEFRVAAPREDMP